MKTSSTNTTIIKRGLSEPASWPRAVRSSLPRWLPSYIVAFAVLALLFGVLFIIVTPPFWGNDEHDHFGRAYEVAHGQLEAKNLGANTVAKGGYGDALPVNVVDYIQKTYSALQTDSVNEKGQHSAAEGLLGSQYNSQRFSQQTKLFAFPNTAPYSPVAYIPSAIGLTVARLTCLNILHTVWFMRLADLLFFVACICVGLYVLRELGARWIIFAVALMPVVVFQASIISADAVINALAFLFLSFWAKTVIGRLRLARWEIIMFCAVILLLPLAKPTYGILLILALIIPAARLTRSNGGKVLILAVLVSSLVLAGAWSAVTADTANAVKLTNTPQQSALVDSRAQIEQASRHPVAMMTTLARTAIVHDTDYVEQGLGALTTINIFVPGIAMVGTVLALGLAVCLAGGAGTLSRRQLGVGAVVLISGGLTVALSLYAIFTPVGYPIIEGIQGRYFFPFLPLLLFLLGAISRGLKIIEASRATILLISLSSMSLLLAFLKLLYVTR